MAQGVEDGVGEGLHIELQMAADRVGQRREAIVDGLSSPLDQAVGVEDEHGSWGKGTSALCRGRSPVPRASGAPLAPSSKDASRSSVTMSGGRCPARL